MSTTERKARKRAGVKHVKAVKVPTPVVNRSHSWRSRFNPKKARTEVRPTRLAVVRYGFVDIGWAAPSKYFTRAGELRLGVR